MLSSEKTFKRKNCLEDVQVEIQTLLEQEFIVEIKQVNHNVREWYLPMQAVLTPDRTTKLRLVFDASAKGQNGKSLDDHLEKGPNYINSLPNVLMAWGFDQVAYTGDMRKMFKVHLTPNIISAKMQTLSCSKSDLTFFATSEIFSSNSTT